MELPKNRESALRVNPSKLVIFSLPKVGKTRLLSALDDNLIIDLEDGTDFYDSMRVKAKNVTDLREIAKAIAANGKPYKYITIDTITVLEDIALELAAELYREIPQGKNWKGTDVRLLPNGAGYLHLRNAFTKLVDTFDDLCETLILVGHVKDKYLEKKPGEEVVASELDLTGKLKSITSASSDAIGWLYRKGDQNILSFKTQDTVVCGARPDHLKNNEILISEITPEGEYKTYWEKVFI